MLDGRKAVVTGGTGYLGAAICKALSHYGARVFFSYNKGEERAAELENGIPNCTAFHLNMRDRKSITAAIDGLHEAEGAFDILVNNAGTSQVMPLSLIEDSDLDLIIDTNVKGTFHVTKAVVRPMLRNRRGVIVNIGSIAGHRLLDVPIHYAMSKAAISGLTLSLASELKRFGIRVNSVVPGLLEDGVGKGVPEELAAEFARYCAAGRTGKAEEVAELVCFLASDKGSYINGQNVFIDGGL